MIFNELAKDCAYSENNISLLQGLIGGKMYLYTELPTPGEAKAKAMPGRLYNFVHVCARIQPGPLGWHTSALTTGQEEVRISYFIGDPRKIPWRSSSINDIFD